MGNNHWVAGKLVWAFWWLTFLFKINFYLIIAGASKPPYQIYTPVCQGTSKQWKICGLPCSYSALCIFECVQAVNVQTLTILSLLPSSAYLSCRYSFLLCHLFFPYHKHPIIFPPHFAPSTLLFCPSLSYISPVFHLSWSPLPNYQHFIIQQGFAGTLWNHLFHG